MASIKKPTPRTLAALTGLPVQPGMRIGLLGGSFNPAHDGHLHISHEAMARLGLQQVWWLVTPRNPLKSRDELAKLKKRVKEAQKVANHPAIHVTRLEKKLGTRYTADTLERLVELGPAVHFVWLMGADNLEQLPDWRRWQDIMRTVPVAVFARGDGNLTAPIGQVSQTFMYSRVPETRARALADMTPPAWTYLHSPLHPQSATALRAAGKWKGRKKRKNQP